MAKLQMFIPITKVDAVQRLVYGLATAEVEDRAKEICDYATTKPYYEKWSEGIAKTTGGKSLGNIRAMHGKVAAGKVTAINFNDDARQIEICAKVVDDAEWNKVLEGVYSGFSQGGAYVRRWADPAQKGVFRYTADPNEISLVDLPCVDIATFDCIKADGSVDKVLIKADGTMDAGGDGSTAGPENQQASDDPEPVYRAKDGSEHKTKQSAKDHNATLAAGKHPEASKAAEGTLAEINGKLDVLLGTSALTDAQKAAAGAASPYGDVDYADPGYQTDKKKRYPIDTAEHIKAAWSYINKAKNQTPYSSAEVEKIKEKIIGAWKEKIEKDGPPSATDKAFIVNEMTKGLYNIARLSGILEELVWLQQSCASEQMWEGDTGSILPASLNENINSLVTTLRAMVLEETEELLTDPADEAVATMLAMAYAAVPNRFRKALVDTVKGIEKVKATGELLEKVGARHSAADLERVQKMHDTSVDLGANCGTAEPTPAGDTTGEAAKHAHGPLGKALGEVQKLSQAVADKDGVIEGLNKSLGEVLGRVEELEKMPGPFKGRVLAIGKEQDGGTFVAQPGAAIDLADKSIPLLTRANSITNPVERARFLTNNARQPNPGAYGVR